MSLHFFWEPPVTGQKLPPDIQSNINAWKQMHDGYCVKIWALSEVEALARALSLWEAVSAIAVCRLPAMKSDIARLLVLYSEGGVYSDLKNRPSRPILSELASPVRPAFTFYPPELWTEQLRDSLFNGFMIAPPRHSFLKAALDTACTNVHARRQGDVYDVTGSGIVTALARSIGNAGLDILPAAAVWCGVELGSGSLRRTHASYNTVTGGRHWTVRQAEGLYVDSISNQRVRP